MGGNKMYDKTIFISWINFNRRSQLIAEKFGIKLYFIQSLKHRYFLSPIRYMLQTIRTLKILFRERPKIIFVQNPPIFAPLVVYLYAKLRNAKIIIDSHTGALLAPWWKWSLPIHAYLSRRALLTIVTNDYLGNLIKSWKSSPFILADIPTVFPQGKQHDLEGQFNIAVINTYAPDEPVEEVLDAAATLPDVYFYITGDTIQAKKKYLIDHPENIQFTGFLPDNEYLGLLQSVQAIMVLTKDNYTMQRGACEAVSLGQPIITSDWPILRDYFHKGTIYVENNSQNIQKGVLEMMKKKNSLTLEIQQLKQERWNEWEKKYNKLYQILNSSM